jgi:hypothetical protein
MPDRNAQTLQQFHTYLVGLLQQEHTVKIAGYSFLADRLYLVAAVIFLLVLLGVSFIRGDAEVTAAVTVMFAWVGVGA